MKIFNKIFGKGKREALNKSKEKSALEILAYAISDVKIIR